VKKFILGFSVAFITLAAFNFLQNSTAQQNSTKPAASLKLNEPLPKTPPVLKLNDPLPANLFVELGKAINPAVVNISTSIIPRGRGAKDPMMEMLEEFYGMRSQPQGKPGRPQRLGLGTGFIIREDGLIVTNNHVIKGADLIQVQLTENTDELFEAKLIGADERSDIALIKIEGKKKFPVAVLGSSKDLQVGEWVAAFGNPFGHGHSMTKGIVSSIGREIGEINRFPLIQTDASINPGNSGGPLVNSKGLVIGINSAIDGRAQGIGFAIPIDEVRNILPQLETRGSIRKGYLGVVLGDIAPNAAESMGIGETPGALIAQVDKNGAAGKAGLKNFDIVTEFGGRKIRSSLDLLDAVAGTEPGKTVEVKILRKRQKLTLPITVTERPEENQIANIKQESTSTKAPFNLGFSVSDITPIMRHQWNLDEEVVNPIVSQVEKNSPAAKLGLQVGDLILEINGSEVTQASEVTSAIKKGRTNTINVARGNRLLSFSFELKR